MKHSKFIWILMGVITVIYIATLFVVRIKNPRNIQYHTYIRWRQAYVIHQTNKRSFVNTSNNRHRPVALSEGQGYGLYITARAGEKGWANEKDFNHLLNYYLAHRDRVGNHYQVPTALMQWRQYRNRHGKWVSNRNSATDGDLFIAIGLHHAIHAWPQQASYYQHLERQLEADMLRYEYNPQTRSLTVGDWVTSKSKYYHLMRTSDVAPDFFDECYQTSHDQRWLTVKNGMLDHLVTLSKLHHTGLVPDFAWVTTKSARPVKPWTVASKSDGNYSANACRVPMMLASSNDPRARRVLNKMMKFFANQYYITAGYKLNGHRLVHYQSASFSAPLFYATSTNRGRGYDNLFNSQKYIFTRPLTKSNYYDATLTTIAALEGMN